jgi:hypothetical protein
MKIVDAHCHVGNGAYKKQTLKELIEHMDSCGVDMAVVCPVEEQITVFNKEGNDFIYNCQKSNPDRVIGFAVANPWFGKIGESELRRALDLGLRGVKFNTAIQGMFINDSIVYPFIEIAMEYNVPVYFHTGTPVYAMPLQLRELAKDFLSVNFILGHGGWADSWTDIMPSCKDCENIFIETSMVAVSEKSPELKVLGPERLLFGSNSPVSTLELELFKLENVKLSQEDRELIMGKNMLRLLNLRS